MKVEKIEGITILITEERLDSLDGPKLKDAVKLGGSGTQPQISN